MIETSRRHYNTERLPGSLGIQAAASARSVHPRLRRAGGSAIPTSRVARASGVANHEPTFEMDQSTGGLPFNIAESAMSVAAAPRTIWGQPNIHGAENTTTAPTATTGK